jgi:hypothetical protein
MIFGMNVTSESHSCTDSCSLKIKGGFLLTLLTLSVDSTDEIEQKSAL